MVLLCIGIAFIVAGAFLMVESRYSKAAFPVVSEPPLVYVIWDELRLASGIILALIGTAMSTASLTYAVIRKKSKKWFSSGQSR